MQKQPLKVHVVSRILLLISQTKQLNERFTALIQ